MKNPPSTLSVWVNEKEKNTWIKVRGRAAYTCSVDFKNLIQRLVDVGYSKFILDVSDCLLMDSTFLGVLSGFGIRFSEHAGPATPAIQLFQPNKRIIDLLENLGVDHLFGTYSGPVPTHDQLQQVETGPENTDRAEAARTSLDAHKTLIQINPENLARFKDVTEFLAMDLKRIEEQNKSAATEGDASPQPTQG